MNLTWDTFEFGSLYLDAVPQDNPQNPTNDGDVPHYQSGQTIVIGDTQPDQKIVWIKPQGTNLLVSDRVILSNVSLQELDKQEFMQGKTVAIDNKKYLCRLLQVGTHEGQENEWDKILDITVDDDCLWHWDKMFFWGANEKSAPGALRGYFIARHWDQDLISSQRINIGFRPVLEPLLSAKNSCSWATSLDGQDFIVSHIPGALSKAFFPQLTPFREKLFRDIANGTTISMYTLLIDGEPVRQDLNNPIKCSKGCSVVFTDRFYGEEYLIPWVISNGTAVAAKAVLGTIP